MKEKWPERAHSEITIPIATPVATERSGRYRLFKVVLYLCGLAWISYSIYSSVERQIDAVFETHGGAMIAHAFGHQNKGKGIPFGKKAEDLFLSVPNVESALAASRLYTAKPHRAGSRQDFATAKYFLELLQTELDVAPSEREPEPVFSAGTPDSRNATLSITTLNSPTAWIDVYYPIMNTPLDRSIEILNDDGSVLWSANLEEIADDTDPHAGTYADAVPAWHGLSRDGEATGKLIYANYGRKEDYDDLVAKGVNFTGAIVITRYGGIFRGLKVKGAEEHGAVGALIYSDPRDDGTVTEENGYAPYPDGPARNPTSVQRGSVQYLSIYPGDPTTPGYPSYENSTRTDGSNIPSIPSLPISWSNARVLLKEIEKGGANHTIKLVNHVDDRVIPIWNTIGVIPGIIKDEVVLIGNHRDAWVLGGSDPSSGTASIHEVVRGLGELVKKGWKPLRTIVIASWDAEEYGLIGSTEWGEDFSSWIDEHVVAYFNLDSSTSGSNFGASASPSLAHFVRSTAEEIAHPTDAGRTLWDATKDRGVLVGKHIIDGDVHVMYAAEVNAVDSVGVGALGSGSDYTVFLQRNGIAAGQAAFRSTLHDPVYHYHSVYDTQRWQELYSDPGFGRHLAVAKHLGLQTVRFTDSFVLPLNTTHYSFELEAYLDKVEKIASRLSLQVDFTSLRDSIHALQHTSALLDAEKHRAERRLVRLLRRAARRTLVRRTLRRAVCAVKKLFGAQCDASAHAVHAHDHDLHVQRDRGSPHARGSQPRVGRFPAWALEQREREMQARPPWGKKLGKKIARAAARVRAVNAKLVAFEKGFIHEDGIKDREWYRHLGVAPGKWLGYGATTFPALTEALTFENNVTLAQYEAGRLKGLIDKLAVKIHP